MATTRERLHQERVRKRWRFVRFLLSLVVLAALLWGGWHLVSQPGVAFGDVVISGSDKFTKQELLALVNCQEPINLFVIPRGKLEAAIKQDVRVADASVSYGLPGVMLVRIVEREPALYICNAYKSYVKVDAKGLVMDISTGIKDGKVAVLSGATCGNTYIGDTVTEEPILAVLHFLEGLTPEAKNQIVEIVLTNTQKVQVRLRYGFPVRLGEVAEVPKKAPLFMTVFEEIKNKNVKAQYIDLQYSKPFIKLDKRA